MHLRLWGCLLEFLDWLLCKEHKFAISLVPVTWFFCNENKFHNEQIKKKKTNLSDEKKKN